MARLVSELAVGSKSKNNKGKKTQCESSDKTFTFSSHVYNNIQCGHVKYVHQYESNFIHHCF